MDGVAKPALEVMKPELIALIPAALIWGKHDGLIPPTGAVTASVV